MSSTLFYAAGVLVMASPFLAIVAILGYSWLRIMFARKGRRPARKLSMIRACGLSVAMGLQFVQVLYRPSTAQVVEAQRGEDMDEEGNGDPETPEKYLHRQLQRIRRGEAIETINVRV